MSCQLCVCVCVCVGVHTHICSLTRTCLCGGCVVFVVVVVVCINILLSVLNGLIFLQTLSLELQTHLTSSLFLRMPKQFKCLKSHVTSVCFLEESYCAKN